MVKGLYEYSPPFRRSAEWCIRTRATLPPGRRQFDVPGIAQAPDPELLKRWFGPRGWSLVVCEVDLKVGGGFRFVLRGPDGKQMGMRGVYREIVPPELEAMGFDRPAAGREERDGDPLSVYAEQLATVLPFLDRNEAAGVGHGPR